MKKIKLILTISLVPLIIFINSIETGNTFVEKYYSGYLYQHISEKVRILTGWINLPVGDLLYLTLIIYLIYFIFFKTQKIKDIIIETGSICFLLTFLFYFLWGFNYKRIAIIDHLELDGNFEKNQLEIFTENLIKEINEKHVELFKNESTKPKNIYDFYESVSISKNNPSNLKKVLSPSVFDLDYKNISVKKSLFSLPLSYMGFSGYINPFTNEANINYKIPPNSLLFVINHEIAHQIGFATEKDANFISYLMLVNSDNEYLKFCGLSYALRLCLSELSKIDENKFKELIGLVNDGIIKDFADTSSFWEEYEGKIEDISKKGYDIYLKQNNIKSGIKNYNESISLILNFKNEINE